MSLVNQDIKNFVSGISQQPYQVRHPEQLSEQVNGFSTEASGLCKRPPTLHEWNAHMSIGVSGSASSLAHFIKRDENEKYMLYFNGYPGAYPIYALQFDHATNTGPRTVTIQEDATYLTTNDPTHDLALYTIADYTFVVNKKVKVQMATDTSTDVWATQGLLVNIKSGQYGRTYSIKINGTQIASYTTPDGSSSSHTQNIATDYIANQLATQATSAGWTATTGPSWVYLTKADTTITSFAVYDGYNSSAAFGFHKTAQKFSNLPATGPDGFVVEVKGETNSDADNYYVKYDASQQLWLETIRPGISYKYDPATMPHVIVSGTGGSFTFKRFEWSNREVGDDNSNAEPSFVGNYINDIVYFKNRLGFLAGENVILSRVADYGNFWVQSATKLQDTDPIDLAVSDSSFCTLRYAVAYDRELVLFSDNAQFTLTCNNTLTPTDAILSPALVHYNVSDRCKPVAAGRNVYFTSERADFTTVRELFTAMDDTNSKDVQDITSHCPNYIPKGVYKIVANTTENMLFFLTTREKNTIYVYKYLFIDGQRVQASWSKWTFNMNITGADVVDNELYICGNYAGRPGRVDLEHINFSLETKDFSTEFYRGLIDRKQDIYFNNNIGTYNSADDTFVVNSTELYKNGVSTNDLWPCPGQYDDLKEGPIMIADNGDIADGKRVYTTATAFYYRWTFRGNRRNHNAVVGIPYRFIMDLSPLMIRTISNNSSLGMQDGRLQLRQIKFAYDKSGTFNVVVNHKGKESYLYTYTGRVLADENNVLDELYFQSGWFNVPLGCEYKKCDISVFSYDPQPVAITGASWTGNYTRKTRLISANN